MLPEFMESTETPSVAGSSLKGKNSTTIHPDSTLVEMDLNEEPSRRNPTSTTIHPNDAVPCNIPSSSGLVESSRTLSAAGSPQKGANSDANYQVLQVHDGNSSVIW